MSTNTTQAIPRWIPATLVVAGVYNLVWGTLIMAAPNAFFEWASIPPPVYPQIWQCVGMIVGVYGIGYLIAARAPYRHWPIVLVGLIGKIAGPVGFVHSAWSDALPWSWGLTIVTNDLIWWGPFTAVLYFTYRHNTDPRVDRHAEPLSFGEGIGGSRSHRGSTLSELSRERPTMVVFLRHSGCTFCREALHDLSLQRNEIESQGVGLAIVHMCSPMQATRLTADSGVDDIHRFSDPRCELYGLFGLKRGTLGQLMSPAVIARGFVASLVNGHGFGRITGDGFQMPGVFILSGGDIVDCIRPRTAADRPDYVGLAAKYSARSSAMVCS